jgi:hypothetical protein
MSPDLAEAGRVVPDPGREEATGVSFEGVVYLAVPNPDTAARDEGEEDDGDDVMVLVVVEGTAVRGLDESVVKIENAAKGIVEQK